MRTAVIIVGELRTWARAAERMFAYFDYQQHDVDYYFATWTSTRDFWWPEYNSKVTDRPVSEDEIILPFHTHGKNLVDHIMIEHDVREDRTYYYQARLSQLINQSKKKQQQEQGFIYNHVVEIRPDLYPVEPFALWGEELEHNMYGGPVRIENGQPMMQDFYYRSSSPVHDILADRYSYRPQKNNSGQVDENEKLVYDWLTAHQIRVEGHVDHQHRFIIRPNFPQDLSTVSYEDSNRLNIEWIAYQWTDKY